jgi:hypothetical protein
MKGRERDKGGRWGRDIHRRAMRRGRRGSLRAALWGCLGLPCFFRFIQFVWLGVGWRAAEGLVVRGTAVVGSCDVLPHIRIDTRHATTRVQIKIR